MRADLLLCSMRKPIASECRALVSLNLKRQFSLLIWINENAPTQIQHGT
jgi:hypothetical protein